MDIFTEAHVFLYNIHSNTTHTLCLTATLADWSEYIIEDDVTNTADNGYDCLRPFLH